MYTNIVAVTATPTTLKELMETAGRVFPNGNDDCRGMIIQIDPASGEKIDVMGLGQTEGIELSNDTGVGPSFVAFQTPKVNHVWLKGSAAVNARVLVED